MKQVKLLSHAELQQLKPGQPLTIQNGAIVFKILDEVVGCSLEQLWELAGLKTQIIEPCEMGPGEDVVFLEVLGKPSAAWMKALSPDHGPVLVSFPPKHQAAFAPFRLCIDAG